MDSNSALDVIGLLLDQGIACIAMHDGFIVAEQHEEQLRQAMIDAVSHLSTRPAPEKKMPELDF